MSQKTCDFVELITDHVLTNSRRNYSEVPTDFNCRGESFGPQVKLDSVLLKSAETFANFGKRETSSQ